MHMEELKWQHKSRVAWLTDRDKNNAFSTLNQCMLKTLLNIYLPLLEFPWRAPLPLVMRPLFYQHLFNQSDYWNAFPSITVKRKLSDRATSWPEPPVSDEEIKHVLFLNAA